LISIPFRVLSAVPFGYSILFRLLQPSFTGKHSFFSQTFDSPSPCFASVRDSRRVSAFETSSEAAPLRAFCLLPIHIALLWKFHGARSYLCGCQPLQYNPR